MNNNKTGRRTLNKLGADHRIELIDYEGEDGFWAYTNPGWCNGDPGSHILHEYNVRDLLSAARSIRPCDCEDCKLPRKEHA